MASRTDLSLSGHWIRLDRVLEGSNEVADSDDIVDAVLAVVSARHNFGEGWAAFARLPTGWLDSTIDNSQVRAAGVGDLVVGGGYELAALWGFEGYAPSLALDLGLWLPTGTENRFDGPVGSLNQVVGFGSGTFGTELGLRFTQFVAPEWALLARGSLRQPFGRSGLGVGYGTGLSYGLGTLWIPTAGLQLRVEMSGQWKDANESPTAGTVENSGGHWLAVGGSVFGAVTDRVTLGVRADGPVFADVNGTQVSRTVTVSGFVNVAFGIEEDEHDHGDGHDHGDHGDHEGHDHGDDHGDHEGHDHGDDHGDHEGHDHGDDHGDGHKDPETDGHADHPIDPATFDVVLSTTGLRADGIVANGMANVEIVDDTLELDSLVVKDTITVIDFWATWCEPCHDVTDYLARTVADGTPIAVRRIDLDAAEALVDAGALGIDKVMLPMLVYYDATGRRRSVQVGASVDDVKSRVEWLLSR